jgi:hypothetical protein
MKIEIEIADSVIQVIDIMIAIAAKQYKKHPESIPNGVTLSTREEAITDAIARLGILCAASLTTISGGSGPISVALAMGVAQANAKCDLAIKAFKTLIADVNGNHV